MKNNRGFSLLELMIAVAIVGIMVSVAVPTYRNHVEKGRVTKACSNLKTLRNAQIEYFYENSGYYPSLDATFCARIGVSQSVFSGDFTYDVDSFGNCYATRVGGQYNGSVITLSEDGRWSAPAFPSEVWPSDLN